MPKLKLTYFDFHGGRGEPACFDDGVSAVEKLGRVQARADFRGFVGAARDVEHGVAGGRELP